MKKYYLMAFFWFAFISFMPIEKVNGAHLRIATYNIWNPVFEEKYSGQNTWKERLPFIQKNILDSDSDVICFEEVSLQCFADLSSVTEIDSQYAKFYFPHEPSQSTHQPGRDGLAIFYRPRKVTLKDIQTLKGSRPTHRRDFYADFQLLSSTGTPATIRIACTHLDSEKDPLKGNLQLEGLVNDVLDQKISEGVDIVVVCGDFNEGQNEDSRPRYEIMQKAGFISDGAIDTTRPEALSVRHNGHVDWIYFKGLSNLPFELIPIKPIGDEKASDHKLTRTDLRI